MKAASKFIIFLACVAALDSISPAAASETSQEDISVDYEPFLSPFNLGQGGAGVYTSRGYSSLSSNPAGIGEDGPSKSDMSHLYLVRVGVQANQNSFALLQDMGAKGGMGDIDIGKSVIEDHGGQRQFARYQITPSFGWSNFILTPVYDNQMAAKVLSDESDLMDIHFSETSGMAFGTGFGGKSSRLRLGASTSALTIKSTKGRFLYSELASSELRPKVTKGASVNYVAAPIHLGAKLLLNQRLNSHAALAIRDFNGTRYESSKKELQPHFKVKQNVTLGFGIAPKLGRYFNTSLTLQGEKLESRTLAGKKRISLGASLSLLGVGEDALLSLQTGVKDAGFSFGTTFNFGLIAFQYANHADDIGVGNRRVVERRQSAVLLINLAE